MIPAIMISPFGMTAKTQSFILPLLWPPEQTDPFLCISLYYSHVSIIKKNHIYEGIAVMEKNEFSDSPGSGASFIMQVTKEIARAVYSSKVDSGHLQRFKSNFFEY